MKKFALTAVLATVIAGGAMAQNVSVVEQFGLGNAQATNQSGATAHGTYWTGSNTAYTGQLGIANISVTNQAGSNTAGTVQIGAFNGSMTNQYGAGNAAATLQVGIAGHQSSTSQVGHGNVSLTTQTD
ncbi:hypothetical protein [Oceanomicrobium pacificus]|uniref:Curlin associated repeat-containing protein n=1 Tax=Oceanomicrobium pacificus TaxID=2692916 RepID=A0A6B0TQ06_9RHOB|nr:hypothetical protein [Oceanomicrobium pacificus]MXU66760.1 hypothetical protein [Oceanomicrobium pacificus]